MTRRRFVTLAASLAPAGLLAGTPESKPESLRKALRYLVAQQSEDGCWKSQVYGAFQSGAALTPMVTQALAPFEPGAMGRGISWLLEHHEEALAIYPVHNASFLLHLATRAPRLHPLVDPLRKRLLGLQLGSKLGWKSKHTSFGGWGYFGVVTRWREGIQLASMQESNLSPTLFAVAGLRAAGLGTDHPALAEAASFIRSCQNYREGGPPNRFDDGGFFQMPGDPWRSKAGVAGTDSEDRQRLKSYSSATADGLRGLLLTGSPPQDPRVLAALDWMRAHPARNDVPHLEFYARYVSREAGRLLPKPLASPARTLQPHRPGQESFSIPQRRNGSWINPAGEYRENDPLVATSMAVMALTPPR